MKRYNNMTAQQAFEIYYDPSSWYRDNDPESYAEAEAIMEAERVDEYDEQIAHSNMAGGR